MDDDIEKLARTRLRSLRRSLGWSLDDVAARANLSASTISRIETGKRTISLDVLVPLCRALQVDLNALLDAGDTDSDVVIRPLPATSPGRTIVAAQPADEQHDRRQGAPRAGRPAQ